MSTVVIAFFSLSNPPSAADDFVPLFNGRNLDGWHNVNCAPETWTVRDKMIVCTGIPKGVMRTERMYENYILEMEWRHMVEGGNAGLFIHSDALPGPGMPFTNSVELQVMDGNHGDIFSIGSASLVPDKPHPNGWKRSLPSEKRQKPAGQWNHYRVESRDGTVTLAVNGKIVSRAYNLNPRKGYICLESEGSEVHFREIKIHELPGSSPPPETTAEKDRGFRLLYNGVDLRGWKDVSGNKGHWTANDWILKYDGQSEAEGEDKHLWSEQDFGNFTLIIDWRQPAEPKPDEVPVILPDGSTAVDSEGQNVTASVLDAGDSGIYLRGSSKAQVNIWNWPVGSGELWGYRTDTSMTAAVRKGVTPILNADNPLNEWNRFEITLIDEKVTVVLNGKMVIRDASLPGIPKRGPLALQHHGDPVEFANIFIKELE